MHQQVPIVLARCAALTLAALASGESVAAPREGGSPDGAAPVGPLSAWSIAGHAVLCGSTSRGGRFDRGTLYCLTVGGEERLLYSFAGGSADGAEPLGGLTPGRDGSLYGVTGSGGRCERGEVGERAAGCGTLFRLTADGNEQLVHSFSGLIEPAGAVIQASDGSFVGVGPDEIYRIAPDGSEAVLHAFGSARREGADPAGLIELASGSFYGTTRGGGASNHGAVFMLTATGEERLIYSFRGGSDGDFPSAALIQGRDGALYGITTYGGGTADMATRCERGCGTVFRVTLEGRESVVHAFRGGMLDGVHPTASLLEAGDGTLYGTTSGGGSDIDIGSGTVFKIAPNGQESTLYAFRDETEGVFPSALVRGPDGSFYGTAGGGRLGQGVVFRIDARGRASIVHLFGRAPRATRR